MAVYLCTVSFWCLGNLSIHIFANRPSAKDLLKHPFLNPLSIQHDLSCFQFKLSSYSPLVRILKVCESYHLLVSILFYNFTLFSFDLEVSQIHVYFCRQVLRDMPLRILHGLGENKVLCSHENGNLFSPKLWGFFLGKCHKTYLIRININLRHFYVMREL